MIGRINSTPTDKLTYPGAILASSILLAVVNEDGTESDYDTVMETVLDYGENQERFGNAILATSGVEDIIIAGVQAAIDAIITDGGVDDYGEGLAKDLTAEQRAEILRVLRESA